MELSIESPCHYVTWKVHEFFQLPSEIGYFLDSPEIRFAGDSYCLRLYPNKSRKDGVKIEISLERLTSTFPERNVSCKIGNKFIDKKGDEFDAYFSVSTLNNRYFLKPPSFEAIRNGLVSCDTFTVLCSIILREQSTGESPQSEEMKTADAEEEQEGLRGQSVFFSSRWRSSKMELSIESPCQHVTWRIPDFFQLLSKIGYSLNSPEFRFADDRYCLRFYPKGDSNEDTADFELQLVRLTSTFPERIVLYKVGCRDETEECDCGVYFYSGTLNDEFGFCLSRSQLEEQRDFYVLDGTLTVLCSMRLGEQSNALSRQSEEVGTSDAEEKQDGLPGAAKLHSDYRRLLKKGAESDSCLVVSGKEFRAHRCVLRARSSVFEAMFGHETTEKASGRVVIDDLDPESFGEFLEYLYTGEVEAGLSDENAVWLYAAADKYDVLTLKLECVEHMRRTLSVDSFCDVMTLALRYREEDLLQHAMQFFKENLARIILTAKWQQFLTDNSTSANELLIKALVPGGQ